jgi:polar amino acid transport system substrate-binding protein
MSRILRNPLLILMLLLVAGCNTMQTKPESTLARIQERGALVLGTSGNMLTMSQADANGKVRGFDIDIARLMADSMGVKLETRVMPFSELLPALEGGEVDVAISNMTITPKRNLRVAFVGPYMTSGKCIVTKDASLAKAQKSQNLNTPDTRLAVLKGSTSEDFARALFPQATVITVDDYAAAAKMVRNDEAGGLLTDYPICLSTLKTNPDAGFRSLFSLLTYEPIGIALPANDAQFINWTQNFLHRLEGTDTLEGLGRRWFGKIWLSR